jgi:hypothetical protein
MQGGFIWDFIDQGLSLPSNPSIQEDLNVVIAGRKNLSMVVILVIFQILNNFVLMVFLVLIRNLTLLPMKQAPFNSN